MRQVRRIGWMLIALGFALAIVALALRYTIGGDLAGTAGMGAAATMLLGFGLWMISALTRLFKGEIRIRPWDALKSAILIFAAMLGLRSLLWLIFPDFERDWIGIIWKSAAFAIAFSLYQTSYRKPA